MEQEYEEIEKVISLITHRISQHYSFLNNKIFISKFIKL